MTFSVEPQDLRAFGSWLDQMTDDTEAAISYAGHTKVDPGSSWGWLLHIIPALDEIATTSDSVFRQLRTVLDASATKVFETARYYEDTDAATAAALDEAIGE